MLLTTKEVAAILRICPASVRTLCDEKKLPCIRHRPGGHRKIPSDAVDKYIASLTNSVETFTPVVVQYEDCKTDFREMGRQLRRAK